MPWEWAGPLATAVVGVAGLAATTYTAERGRKAQRDQAAEQRKNQVEDAAERRATEVADRLRNERRQVYIRFIDRHGIALDAVLDLRRQAHTGQPQEQVDAALTRCFQTYHELNQVVTELRLVNAPDAILERALRSCESLGEAAKEAYKGGSVARLFGEGRIDSFTSACVRDLDLVTDSADSARTEDAP